MKKILGCLLFTLLFFNPVSVVLWVAYLIDRGVEVRE